jgi:hypothetical protein
MLQRCHDRQNSAVSSRRSGKGLVADEWQLLKREIRRFGSITSAIELKIIGDKRGAHHKRSQEALTVHRLAPRSHVSALAICSRHFLDWLVRHRYNHSSRFFGRPFDDACTPKPRLTEVPPGYDVWVKASPSADLIHNSNRVKSPRFQEGKIPIFRIGALLILINKMVFFLVRLILL